MIKLKTVLVVFALLLALAAFLFFCWRQNLSNKILNKEGEAPNRVCFGGGCFRVSLAITARERSRGLMYREELGRDEGMLFVFNRPGVYSFWMKNTLIPLDIIWIGEDLRVADICEDLPPCKLEPCASYAPGAEAAYVLEVNAGEVEKRGISIGDRVRLMREN
ncbi:hypothetical protein B5M47_00105 [candidate division CPR3 bacterium 4484_211]|uniref:DUF192 domain-containing protein n=1 Tax=candidate division CPR3 bacterium 4484_211 TaxID=1968527 RepID=A0A1W9NZM8_UNCC3|nr:MAG: hypothetical protein B5M47_00105 [candidate division CPR3 bacterium 4484_211]